MLKIHNANNNRFLFFGDIHGLFKEFIHFLTKQCNIEDINIVICGDFGLGFYKPNYYKTLFHKLNKKLKLNNIHLYAFRGNHDDPEYFSNEEFKSDILDNITNIHIVDDYDFIINDNNTILCIGGARSVDKCYRQKWDKITQKLVYEGWWENEMIKDIPENFNDFITDNNININIICSHSSPDFCEPLSKEGLREWAERDETLIDDCNKERALLTNVYNTLKNNHKLTHWFYGHFHNTYTLVLDGVLFRGVNLFNGVFKTDFFEKYDEK